MGPALGTQQWLTIKEYPNPKECIDNLKAQGYRVLATDLHGDSASLYDVDWSVKTSVVFGNELKGITQEMRQIVDGSVYIPMRGFAESLNLSVACAVTCLSTL
eukprot:c19403_g1_i5.p2 GENE.c19403_g1_i5~~c19403_g1_i5.p2  ORF type:complete len:103 (-),score=12.62 c19403_g1_i5:297-605(-)